MDRLFATVSMNQGDQSQRPGQGAGLFAVESVMNPEMFTYMPFSNTDTGKVPPNLRFR